MARQMKVSGIEWIGEIPANWKLQKGKFLYRQRSEKGNSVELQLLSPTQKYGVIPQSLYEKITGMKPVQLDEKADLEQFKSIYTGDFCISLRSFQGGFEYSQYNGVVSPAYQVFYRQTDTTSDAFYRYIFKEMGFIGYMNSFTKSFRDGKSIAFDDFAGTLLPVPPIEEQNRIASLLDSKCAEIDAVIERTKATIEEYKKLKQAVITEAVTKGVRGARKMKDSGIEWIGEIPEEWGVRKLFRAIDAIGDIDHYMPESVETGVPYLMTGDLRENVSQIQFAKCKQVSNEDYLTLSTKIKATQGDVIFARYATIGTVCYVDVDKEFLVSYSCLTIKPTHNLLLGKFLFYYLKSTSFYEDVRQYINSNTQANVGLDSMTKAKIVLPSVCEQEEIIKYLDEKCAALDILIAKKTALLTELETYKKSLIYEYVTGKKEAFV